MYSVITSKTTVCIAVSLCSLPVGMWLCSTHGQVISAMTQCPQPFYHITTLKGLMCLYLPSSLARTQPGDRFSCMASHTMRLNAQRRSHLNGCNGCNNISSLVHKYQSSQVKWSIMFSSVLYVKQRNAKSFFFSFQISAVNLYIIMNNASQFS